jgi:signal transduction histidine kinase
VSALGGEQDPARLERLRTRLEAVERIAGLGSWELDLPDGPARWSSGLHAILGWDGSPDGGFDRLLRSAHPMDRRRVAEVHAAAVQDGSSYSVEHRILRGGAVRRVHQDVTVELDGDRPVRLVGTVQDVTERASRARRLLEVESRRRELLHRLVRASDDARTHLAGDLHDGPVQVLTATAMRLEVLARTGAPPPEWLGEALPVVRDVATELRDVLFDLHPQVTGSGIRDTIAHLAGTVLPGTGIAVTVTGEEPRPDTARALHGLVQEAFWGVREHDSADALRVDLTLGDDTVVVVDGGDGERPLLTRAGLLGVSERCEAAGGTAGLGPGGRVLRCTLPGAVVA